MLKYHSYVKSFICEVKVCNFCPFIDKPEHIGHLMFSEQAEAVRAVPAFINNKGKSMAPLVPKLTCICQKYKYIKFGEF